MLILNAALTVYIHRTTSKTGRNIFRTTIIFHRDICRVGYTYSPDTRQQNIYNRPFSRLPTTDRHPRAFAAEIICEANACAVLGLTRLSLATASKVSE